MTLTVIEDFDGETEEVEYVYVYKEENGELFNDDECLFYDFVSQQYFSATMDEVIQKVTMDDGLECYIITTPYDLSAS